MHDHLVEPVYEPTEFVPVVDGDEEWPACPVGWNFDDWIFSAATELTIGEVYTPQPPRREQLAVNRPQGSGLVQLSFERLRLLPGERTKFSVCINPEGSDATGTWNVSFVWRAVGHDYFVNFDGTGRLLSLSRLNPTTNQWADAAANFDVDRENRIIAFTRPVT